MWWRQPQRDSFAVARAKAVTLVCNGLIGLFFALLMWRWQHSFWGWAALFLPGSFFILWGWWKLLRG